jgi:heme-degrading monooxygenase HmoA|tara:strand:+ start:352 stop:729 length:378 start_codon:yes stop_codon:yes gene_type:complete
MTAQTTHTTPRTMAVLFESWPEPGRTDAYYDLAAALRPTLEGIDGFISMERFASTAEPGKILSLSVWRDAAAVARWRDTLEHRRAQATGRTSIFIDYRLRVVEVVRDYGKHDRAQAPADSRTVHG